MTQEKLGNEGKLYYADAALDATNTPDTATWNEIDNVKGVTLNTQTGKADVTTRGTQGWKATRATLKEGSVEFEMNWITGDAAFEAVKDAWLANSTIPLAVMSGDIAEAGEEGLAANFAVTNFSRQEPLEEVMTVKVTAEPASQISWYEVAAA